MTALTSLRAVTAAAAVVVVATATANVASAASAHDDAAFIGTTFKVGANDTSLPDAVVNIDGVTGAMTPIILEENLGMVDGAAYNPHKGDLFLFSDEFVVRCNVPSQSCDFQNMMSLDTGKCDPSMGDKCVEEYQWSSKLQKVVAMGFGFPWNASDPVNHLAAIDVYHPKNVSGVLTADVTPIKVLSDLDINMGQYMDSTSYDDATNKYYTVLATAQQRNGTIFEFDVANGSQRTVMLKGGLSAQFPLVAVGGSRLVAWTMSNNSFIVIDTRTGDWKPLKMSKHLPGLPSLNSLVYDPKSDSIAIFCVGGHDAPNATMMRDHRHHHHHHHHHHNRYHAQDVTSRPLYRFDRRGLLEETAFVGRGGDDVIDGKYIDDAWFVRIDLKTGETRIEEPYHLPRFVFHNSNNNIH